MAEMVSYHFLIDVNLPKFFSFFNTPDFEFVVDLDPSMSDEDIWDYAVGNDLVIVTKDTDFYFKCLVAIDATKVVHLKLGNMRIKDLHQFFREHWEEIVEKLEEARLIVVTKTGITLMILES